MIPVFLPLRELKDPNAGLAAFIQAQLYKNRDLGTGPDFGSYSDKVRLESDFRKLHIRPLSDEQVETFVRNWYHFLERDLSTDKAPAEVTAERRETKLLEKFTAGEFRSAARVYEMTANPLLLANLCLVRRDRGELPRGSFARSIPPVSDSAGCVLLRCTPL